MERVASYISIDQNMIERAEQDIASLALESNPQVRVMMMEIYQSDLKRWRTMLEEDKARLVELRNAI